MKTKKPKAIKIEDRNEDPITHQPGAHPITTGIGAASAGIVGAVIGTAVGGPIGGLVGAAVGGLAGGAGGSAAGEALDPSDGLEDEKGVSFDQTPNQGEDALGFPVVPIGMGAGLPFGGGIMGAESFPPSGFVPLDPWKTDNSDAEYSLSSGEPEGDSASAMHAQIAEKAWQIYQAEGCPEGKSQEHWAQAERELRI